MPKHPNIFQDVIRDEPTLTRLLVNFLGFDSFREEFFKLFLDHEKAKSIQSRDIEINYPLNLPGNKSHPDLAVIKSDFDVLIEIKNSPYTGLTENQPDSYFKYLAESSGETKQKYLGFLVPQHYYYLREWESSIDKLRKSTRIHLSMLR